MVAKLGKDPSCAKGSKYADPLVSSHFTLPTLPSNLWGNVSAITDVRFLNGSGAQIDSLAFRELLVQLILAVHPHAGALLTFVCHRATYHIDGR